MPPKCVTPSVSTFSSAATPCSASRCLTCSVHRIARPSLPATKSSPILAARCHHCSPASDPPLANGKKSTLLYAVASFSSFRTIVHRKATAVARNESFCSVVRVLRYRSFDFLPPEPHMPARPFGNSQNLPRKRLPATRRYRSADFLPYAHPATGQSPTRTELQFAAQCGGIVSYLLAGRWVGRHRKAKEYDFTRFYEKVPW